MQGGVALCYVDYYVTFLLALGVIPVACLKKHVVCLLSGWSREKLSKTGGGDSEKTPHRSVESNMI